MVTKISDGVEEISHSDIDPQIMGEGSDTVLPEFIEEHLRYEQVIRELTEFEETCESTDSALDPTTHIGE